MKWIIRIISFAILFFMFDARTVSADAGSISLDYPSNQLKKDVSYYDLLVTPGQQQDLSFKIVNISNQDKKYKVTISPAITGDNGVIVYNNTKAVISTSVPFDVRDYIKVDHDEYIVKAQHTDTIPIHLTLPDFTFSGRVVAGLTIEEIQTATGKDSDNNSSGSITSKISNQIPIALQQSTERPKPKVDYRTTTASLVNGYRNFQVKLENPIANVINGANVKVKIYRNDKVIAKKSFKNGSYAPNTKFNYNIPLGKNEKFVAGKYRAKVTVAAENGNEWNFNEPFTVTPEKAEDLNKKAVSTKAPLNIWLIVAVVFGILTIGVLITLIVYLVKTRK